VITSISVAGISLSEVEVQEKVEEVISTPEFINRIGDE